MTLSIFLCAYGLFVYLLWRKDLLKPFKLGCLYYQVLFIYFEQKQRFIGNENERNIESLWRESSNYPGAVDLISIWSSSVSVPLVAFSFFANYSFEAMHICCLDWSPNKSKI